MLSYVSFGKLAKEFLWTHPCRMMNTRSQHHKTKKENPQKTPKQETHNLAHFPIRKANQNETHYSSDACSNLYSIKTLFISILC
ncbi:hypothetical protein L2E82_47644 [Cichorium intybus]|uniref:Uncharacterized protein n=1 Tax=Cichorium intybus TaxID=13427 RepID=A0ACB8YXJ5_CICIN|nr:hypothetical protein L2E82_47644 [Cichorium intybus]